MGVTTEWRYYLPGDEPQIPLDFKFDTKPLWEPFKAICGVGAAGAAMALAAYEASKVGKAVSYSRNRNYYHGGRHPLMTYTNVTRGADDLEAGQWIQHYKQAPGCRGWQSAFEATPELVDAVEYIMQGHPRLKLEQPRHLTILRDADGKPMDFKPTREIDRRDRKTATFNEAISSAEIIALDGTNLACPMARIYNQDMSRGGRFYGMGTSWQNIKSEARKALTIDGEPVVELDFKTLHPAILYAEAGVPMPADCYDIDGWPRNLVKVAMLTLINATTESKARFSIAHSDRMAQVAKPGSQEAIQAAARLIDAIKRKHAPIARSFHSDAGARLMRIDSDIAEGVMGLLIARKGIVTLPVHDSFLVPASKREELEAAMDQAAYDVCRLKAQITEAK
ncbi:hypothetical protein [Paracoccus binzhouensis]|uniref:hypothetical protein n=1 Tax=Paracoccus binzhouensis TaxID=2796149 RepID=UPI0018EEEA45|nr:hypothetical protein [Paracoccus binzhouensis]